MAAISPVKKGIFFGAQSDLWLLNIDYENTFEEDRRNCSSPGSCLDPYIPFTNSGTTQIIVFQPTGIVGYRFSPRASHLSLAVMIALGAEVNVYSDGRPVGEGAIFLIGLSLGY